MNYYRKRLSPLSPKQDIDYKDTDLLRKFITERGKILPRRI
ncbi:MAG: 30S ribosomal protein S18, partial [Microcystaceae cyanobacterium]